MIPQNFRDPDRNRPSWLTPLFKLGKKKCRVNLAKILVLLLSFNDEAITSKA